MKLSHIVDVVSPLKVVGDSNQFINGLALDSRKVEQGFLFVAIAGYEIDGHKFINTAIQNGASAVLCSTFPEQTVSHVTYILVKDTSIAVGFAASCFYGSPSSQLKVVGITGTNGKTTVASLLFDLFTKFGFICGLISTVENRIAHQVLASTHTTPDAITLQRLLADMVEAGCDYVFMEVSSHAAHQHRIAGLSFAMAVFTNLSHDHLDYHKTFDAYRDAKKMFFDGLTKNAIAIINTDDKNGRFMVQNSASKVFSYALKSQADFKVKVIESSLEGMLVSINETEFWSQLVGNFNAYNLAAIYCVAVQSGIESVRVLEAISTLKSVSGRFEIVRSDTNIIGVVDYAHTPDALENILSTLSEVKGSGNIITVIGCGGDRDTAKRPKMARIAAEKSKKVIITSDNPRTEDPQIIADQMMNGLEITQKKNAFVNIDRKMAIRFACEIANSGDIVLVAGKGHETYQEINGIKHPFDDQAILSETLKNLHA